MSAAIPFFDELPPRAVKASCRLWDAIMSPGYNGVTAYGDFSLDLTREGIDPPPRAIVRRWKAAIELGLVKRPATADEVAPLPVRKLQSSGVSAEGATDNSTVYSPTTKGKAERKHRETMRSSSADVLVAGETGEAVQPVVIATVDKEAREIAAFAVDDGSGEDTGMEGVLDDLGVLPMSDPGAPISARPMEAAFKGAQFAPVIDDAEALLDAVARELNAAPFTSPPAPALVGVKVAAGRLLEEVIIQMTREIEHSARERTDRMLREVADEFERGAPNYPDFQGASRPFPAPQEFGCEGVADRPVTRKVALEECLAAMQASALTPGQLLVFAHAAARSGTCSSSGASIPPAQRTVQEGQPTPPS